MADDDKTQPERFPVADIMARSGSLFDQPSFVMAGALHGYRNEMITEAEAKKRLDAFLKREVS